MLAAQDRRDLRRPTRIGPIVESQRDPSTRRRLGGNKPRAPSAQNRPAMGKWRPPAHSLRRTYAARTDRVGRNPFEQDRDSRNNEAEREQTPVRRNPQPRERLHLTASSIKPLMSTSSSFARALSCSFRATRWRSGSFSFARALSCSFRATRQHYLTPADQPQPLPQTPWPTPPDGDPRRRAAEAAVASRVQEDLAKVAGHVRTESPQRASNRAHPARSPTARPETARTRDDRPVATTEHAFLLDPQGQQIRRRPSFRCPSAQRSFATQEQRTDKTFPQRAVTSYAIGLLTDLLTMPSSPNSKGTGETARQLGRASVQGALAHPVHPLRARRLPGQLQLHQRSRNHIRREPRALDQLVDRSRVVGQQLPH